MSDLIKLQFCNYDLTQENLFVVSLKLSEKLDKISLKVFKFLKIMFCMYFLKLKKLNNQ